MVFHPKNLAFLEGGKEVTLQGTFHKEIDIVEGKLLSKLLQIKGLAYKLQFIERDEREEPELHLKEVEGVIEEFSGIFEEPKGLPPSREFDHHIPLVNPQLSVNARPYLYPFHQKNEIERQVREMMLAGIIQHSSSHFASPIVLVLKADGSWRLVWIIGLSTATR